MNVGVEEILLAEISWAGLTGLAWLTEGGKSGCCWQWQHFGGCAQIGWAGWAGLQRAANSGPEADFAGRGSIFGAVHRLAGLAGLGWAGLQRAANSGPEDSAPFGRGPAAVGPQPITNPDPYEQLIEKAEAEFQKQHQRQDL